MLGDAPRWVASAARRAAPFAIGLTGAILVISSLLTAGPAHVGIAGADTTTTSFALGAFITSTAAAPLAPGQVITVTGRGFEEAAAVFITECGAAAASADLPNDCDIQEGSKATADLAGDFTVQFSALVSNAPRPNEFEASDGVQCPSSGVNGCILVATDLAHRQEHVDVAIPLLPYAAPTTTTVAPVVLLQPVTLPRVIGPVGHLANTGGDPRRALAGAALLAGALCLTVRAPAPLPVDQDSTRRRGLIGPRRAVPQPQVAWGRRILVPSSIGHRALGRSNLVRPRAAVPQAEPTGINRIEIPTRLRPGDDRPPGLLAGAAARPPCNAGEGAGGEQDQAPRDHRRVHGCPSDGRTQRVGPEGDGVRPER